MRSRTAGGITRAAVKIRRGDDEDRLTVKLAFDLPTGSDIAPDAETVTLTVTQSGNAGFSASLPSLMTDLQRGAPAYRYIDRAGSVGGVTKAQIKGSASGSFSAGWKVRGPGIGDVAAGPATISLTIGDDTFEAALDCSASGARVSCGLAP